MATVKTLLVRNQVKNIIEVYKQATDVEINNGIMWYKTARRWCEDVAYESGAPTFKVAAVVAVLSPGVDWERNKMDANDIIKRYLIKGKKPNPYRYGTYPANVEKAVNVWNAATVVEIADIVLGKGALKTHAFFWNIMGFETTHVTIDRHAYKAANNIYEGGAVPMHAKRYKDTQSAYMTACVKINESEGTNFSPAQLQAIVWLAYKRLNNHKKGIATDYVEPF